jgi:uncharacterized YigZ family protein
VLTLKSSAQVWTQVKNSRFLAELFTVHSAEEAKEEWRFRKETYDNGGHIVYAFTVGAQQNVSGCSDDGEPSGTAGRPVLAVLHGSGLADAMITVARWFGGTKLGTGGLVHAYGDAARAVLAAAELIEYAPLCEAAFSVPYAQYAVCRKFLESIGFSFDEEIFSETVFLRGRLRRDDRPLLENFLRDLGSGGIVCTFLDV